LDAESFQSFAQCMSVPSLQFVLFSFPAFLLPVSASKSVVSGGGGATNTTTILTRRCRVRILSSGESRPEEAGGSSLSSGDGDEDCASRANGDATLV
jgi:hypothetical protein